MSIMKRLLIMFLFMLFLVSTISARSLESHFITVDLDASGNAVVLESYTMGLEIASNDFTAFDNISAEAKDNIGIWQTFMKDIDISLVGEASELLITSSKQRNFGQVNLEYKVNNFAKLLEERGRFTVWGITEDLFTFYDAESGIFTIPSKTTLWVRFDKDYEIVETKPTPSLGPYIEDEVVYRLGWTGPLPTTEFSVKYKAEKGISESFDVMRIFGFFVENPVYGVAVLIIIVLLIIYRKQIIGVVSEGFAGAEEIEPPKKEL